MLRREAGASPSIVLAPAQSKSRRLAAKACWAAWVRMADQRERREASTALPRMSGAALTFVWASKRTNEVASGLHRPPISRAKTTSLHLLERRSSGYVGCSLFRPFAGNVDLISFLYIM